MRHVKPHIRVLAVTAAACLLCFTPAEAKKPDKPGGGGGGDDAGLEYVELGNGSANSFAYAINNAGIVVGIVDRFAGTWNANDQTPTFEPLAALGFGVARAINEAGEIVGAVGGQPTYWANREDDPIDLPLPDGYDDGQANSISADGVVVGQAFTTKLSAAVAWRVSEGVVRGPVVLSGVDAGANGVASLGAGANRAVGEAPTAGGSNVATAWDIGALPDGSFVVIGSTVLIPDRWSRAYAITGSGDISGVLADTAGNDLGWPDTAFVIRGGTLYTLPDGRRDKIGRGRDLNDTDVVGSTGFALGREDAARWNSRNKLEDLTSYLGGNWSQSDAFGTNDLGEVVGGGEKDGSGVVTAWLLRVPPSQ